MSRFQEPGLEEFLAALAANGTPPSKALIRAISKLSGKTEKEIQGIYTRAAMPNPGEKGQPGEKFLP